VFHAVSSLLGCLPELSNNNNQPSTTSYALLCYDCFNVLINIDIVAFITTRRHTCVWNYRSGLETKLNALRAHRLVLNQS